jgi:hypothetical protein
MDDVSMEKTHSYSRVFGFRKYDILSFFNGVFERFLCVSVLRL